MSFSNPNTFVREPPWRVCWIRGAVRGIRHSPNPSNSIQAPVNWEDKPLWGSPTVAQLHPSLLPPGSIMGTFNQAVLTLGPSETLQILRQTLGRRCSLQTWFLVSLVSPQPDVTQPCFGGPGSTCHRVPAAMVGAPSRLSLPCPIPAVPMWHSVTALEEASPRSFSRAAGPGLGLQRANRICLLTQ